MLIISSNRSKFKNFYFVLTPSQHLKYLYSLNVFPHLHYVKLNDIFNQTNENDCHLIVMATNIF